MIARLGCRLVKIMTIDWTTSVSKGIAISSKVSTQWSFKVGAVTLDKKPNKIVIFLADFKILGNANRDPIGLGLSLSEFSAKSVDHSTLHR